MKIGGLQKLSLSDYPGEVCATVFTRGCNFRCGYCHNPELVDPFQYSALIPESEVLSFLEQRRGRLDAVTVSGGEPTLQKDLEAFLKKVKLMGYRVKVDTNGTHPERLAALIDRQLADYIAMDVKGPLDRYRVIAGVDADPSRIEKSVRLIIGSGVAHEFRTTLVRSQLQPEEVLSLAGLLKDARLWMLQTFVAAKTLEKAFLAESSYTTEELTALARELKRSGLAAAVR